MAAVNISGALKRELSVLLRSEKLREFNVSVGDVVSALRAQNTNAPVGKVRGRLDEESIRLVGRIEPPAKFKNIVIKRFGGQVVRLGQVATIEDGFADVDSLSTRSGKPNGWPCWISGSPTALGSWARPKPSPTLPPSPWVRNLIAPRSKCIKA